MRGLSAILAVGLAVALCAGVAQAKQTPSIAFTPSSFDFGTVASGSSSSETFTLKNTGGSASAALSISLSGSSAFAITADGCKGSLGPNKSCTLTVTYRPGTSGSADAATLTAQGNKAAATATAALTGNTFASFNQMSCASDITCVVATSLGSTSVSVAATGTGASTVQAGIVAGALNCAPYLPHSMYPSGTLNEDLNTYTVLSSSSSYGKTVTISYPARFTHDTGEGGGTYDNDRDFDDVEVCFQAPYDFAIFGGGMAPASPAGFTGLLPDCPAAPASPSGPCVDRSITGSKFTPTDETGIDFQFSMVIDIPAGETGDPRMN
ncbi:MAG: choice-of-anchor D domain-containing protein [Solirubrobacteraceae bacterium]